MIVFSNQNNINGLLLLDKSIGLTSNKILQKIKILFNIHKAGYIGTLDPLASGLLPICFGRCTKFAHLLSEADKIYEVTARLGIKTDTADSYGKIIMKNSISNLTITHILNKLTHFLGEIQQIPNIYSAIKYNGMPLYWYARNNIINLKIPVRKIIIYKIILIYFNFNILKLKIHCSKGTYIRSIIDNLGDKLRCGAHVIQLRRLNIAHISITHNNVLTDQQVKILIKNYKHHFLQETLINKLILPIQYISRNFPNIYLTYDIIENIRYGKKHTLKIMNITNNKYVNILEKYTYKFIGIGIINHKQHITKYILT
ncbi:tRNA pseudouridine(55) synthase TruB [Enterobacteriaceae endosymbiont of Macroplea appendiculata]|uniref:tRNA pseudouridine(55) synthase TruB n=1 Tax=Enterobacteriaceae endosymbiont of Macroplea appendiculata TaxID=2675790 RepID=UPI0014497690|nr:tRNA pseudouridine(55) synthase TruB [Enterobacteriaceae endosymbiont of Macroplea appendiculata]QJC30913.1 tRNA pseudouridine(55) synthase TruB [Enterobacteriaceae endosymbiont of Macroplea appendiculata]